jgi:hypothetical protein
MREYQCVGGEWTTEPHYWVNDARGIPLARVCPKCRAEKLSKFRQEILTGYDQSDVDERIEEDY